MSVGIYAIGQCLPRKVRGNDWWPTEIVESWGERIWDTKRADRALEETPTEGARKVLAAIAEHSADPFHGSVERRVLGDDDLAADLEAAAAEEAIERAGVARDDIDLLLGFTLIPDYINAPNPCLVHERLGLPKRCMTMSSNAVCNSFQMQLAIADSMISTSRARYALLTQCSAVWRVTEQESSQSVHMGDGATAVIMGPVSEGRGLLAQSHRTDGSEALALICTVPGRRWWHDGPVVTQSLDRSAVRQTVLRFADRGKSVIDECLEQAGLTTGDIDFFACHQATAWFQSVMQEHTGLSHARSVDIHKWAGSLSSANLPLEMYCAERDGLLHDGDVIAMYQGGTGATYSGSLFRWGR